MVFDGGDDKANDAHDDQNNDKHKPDWANNNVFGDGRNCVVVIDGLFDFDNAEYRKIVDLTSDIAGGVWHDDFGKMIVLVFVSGKDSFASDVVRNI